MAGQYLPGVIVLALSRGPVCLCRAHGYRLHEQRFVDLVRVSFLSFFDDTEKIRIVLVFRNVRPWTFISPILILAAEWLIL